MSRCLISTGLVTIGMEYIELLIKGQLKYFETIDEKIQRLKRKLEALECREDDIKEELKSAEHISLKKRRKEVENWLTDVGRMKNQVHQIEQQVPNRRWYTQLSLSKSMDKSASEITELIKQGGFPKGLTLEAADQNGGFPFLATNLAGKMFESNRDMILEYVMNDSDSVIGIYGMGGVGKTALVTHTFNQLLNHPNTCVSWVTVSRNFSIYKLQNDIAKTLHLDLSDENDERKRAARLAWALRRRSNFVLILDDVWHHIPLDEVGIPVSINRCKLILTTRSLEVCRRMDCQKHIKVEPLGEEEAWKLFMEKLGAPGVTLPHEVERIARSLAKQCAGLPLGIITMAGSMKGVDDICEWSAALERIKVSKMGHEDMEQDVFHVLKYSFDKLKDPNVQQCFLYCSLFPEDFKIDRHLLITYFIDEGFIGEMNSRRVEFIKGHTILNKLENACLLEGGTNNLGKRFVKMHDLLRDMAIKIGSVSTPLLVEARVGLKDIPQEEKWTDDLVRVSLMCNSISKISSIASPKCPRLSTLLFQENFNTNSIPSCFFSHMNELKVLDLSGSCIDNLPNSISDLRSLTALLLRECRRLEHVPSLAKLKALRRLDLANTLIVEVPHGMEKLVNLKYLNMDTRTLKMIPDGILSKLCNLQYLVVHEFQISTARVRGEEIASLNKLEIFKGQLYNINDLNTYIKSWGKEGLSTYLLQVGLYSKNDLFKKLAKAYRKALCIQLCNISESKVGRDSLVLPKDIQCLYICQCQDATSLCDVSSLRHATDLRLCFVDGCYGMKHMLCSSSCNLPLVRSLESIHLENLLNLHGLVGRERGAISSPISPTTFSSLTKFSIYGCPNIKILFTPPMASNLQNLAEIRVRFCEQMVEILASDEDEELILEDDADVITKVTFPNLTSLELWVLPELKSFSRSRKADCMQQIFIWKCPKLEDPFLRRKNNALPFP